MKGYVKVLLTNDENIYTDVNKHHIFYSENNFEVTAYRKITLENGISIHPPYYFLEIEGKANVENGIEFTTNDFKVIKLLDNKDIYLKIHSIKHKIMFLYASYVFDNSVWKKYNENISSLFKKIDIEDAMLLLDYLSDWYGLTQQFVWLIRDLLAKKVIDYRNSSVIYHINQIIKDKSLDYSCLVPYFTFSNLIELKMCVSIKQVANLNELKMFCEFIKSDYFINHIKTFNLDMLRSGFVEQIEWVLKNCNHVDIKILVEKVKEDNILSQYLMYEFLKESEFYSSEIAILANNTKSFEHILDKCSIEDLMKIPNVYEKLPSYLLLEILDKYPSEIDGILSHMDISSIFIAVDKNPNIIEKLDLDELVFNSNNLSTRNFKLIDNDELIEKYNLSNFKKKLLLKNDIKKYNFLYGYNKGECNFTEMPIGYFKDYLIELHQMVDNSKHHDLYCDMLYGLLNHIEPIDYNEDDHHKLLYLFPESFNKFNFSTTNIENLLAVLDIFPDKIYLLDRELYYNNDLYDYLLENENVLFYLKNKIKKIFPFLVASRYEDMYTDCLKYVNYNKEAKLWVNHSWKKINCEDLDKAINMFKLKKLKW